jgi:L-iditol 2-dehydrogenase
VKVLRYVGPQQLSLEEADIPRIGDGEVLARVDTCGICATDVKTFLKGHARIEAGRVLGHEISGTVMESRAPDWHPGDVVAIAPYVPCLKCPWCERGQYTLCARLFDDRIDPGGFSEYLRVTRSVVGRGLMRIPDGSSPETGSFAEPLACSLHGLRRLGAQAGESIMIVGDGVMGLLQAGLAKAIGLSQVIVAGATEERLAFARRLADATVDVRSEDPVEFARQLTDGIGPDHVMVSVPVEEALATAIQAVRRGGTINVFAGFPKGSLPSIDINRIHYQEVDLVGSFGFSPRDFRDGIRLAVAAGLPLVEMVTERVPLARAEQAMRDAARWSGLKTLVEMAIPDGAAP